MPGLTAIELLVALAVGAIVLATGAPGFRYLVLEARMTATVNAMVRDLHLARQTANLRRHAVTLCPGAALAGCPDNRSWAGGWGIVISPPSRATPSPVVLTRSLPATGIRVVSNRRSYSFRPYTLRDTNGTIGFCDQRGQAAVRALVISPTGRPRLASRAESRLRIKCDL